MFLYKYLSCRDVLISADNHRYKLGKAEYYISRMFVASSAIFYGHRLDDRDVIRDVISIEKKRNHEI